MKKRLFLICFVLLFCTGCMGYEELNSLSIISNITIEKEEGKYQVIMQEIIPTKKDNGVDYVYKYRRSSSKNLESAIKKITNHSPKTIYLKKVQNVIIGENEKKEIIQDFLKYYKKNKDFNKLCSLVIAQNDLYKVLKVNSDYQYIDSVLKDKKRLLKDLSRAHNQKIRIPILRIDQEELIFVRYYSLQV